MQLIDTKENHRVLIIDDNPTIHEDFHKILCPTAARVGAQGLAGDAAALFGSSPVAPTFNATAAFEMDFAFQGQEGLEKVRQAVAARRPYALAFVDGRMPPGWDGVETIGHLWETYPDLQVVICTAYSDYSWEQIIHRLGQSDGLVILKKPFDTVEVLQLAHAMTRRWMLNQQARSQVGQLNQLIEERTVELDQSHKQLAESSRQAGMAEVATGALHNVGNVLNSVTVASTYVADRLRKSKAAGLSKVVAMLREHGQDLGAFLTNDAKGKQLPGYLAQLADHLAGEQAIALNELAQLQNNIDHIRDIVTTQQSCAKVSGVIATVNVSELIEDALSINASGLARQNFQVSKEFEEVPPVTIEKHKVLQILVNLMRNAEQSCRDSGREDKKVTIRLANGNDRVRIMVCDNGVGIPPENLARIFAHGFTTKSDGHGFGLHSGALAAKELGGALSVHSDGVGRGATFTLELPLQPPAERAA